MNIRTKLIAVMSVCGFLVVGPVSAALAQGLERHYAIGQWSQDTSSPETVLGSRIIAVDYTQLLPKNNRDFGQITLWNEITPGGLGVGTWVEVAYRATCNRIDGCTGNQGSQYIENRCLVGEHGFIPERQQDGTIKHRLTWSAKEFEAMPTSGFAPNTGKRMTFNLVATDSTAKRWFGGIGAEVGGNPQWLCDAQLDGIYDTGDPELVGLKKLKVGAEITQDNPLVTVPATNMILLQKTNSVWSSNDWDDWSRGSKEQDSPPYSIWKSQPLWLCVSTVQSACGS